MIAITSFFISILQKGWAYSLRLVGSKLLLIPGWVGQVRFVGVVYHQHPLSAPIR